MPSVSFGRSLDEGCQREGLCLGRQRLRSRDGQELSFGSARFRASASLLLAARVASQAHNLRN